ncbi:hypothetical protein BpHYR1_037589 [Brachionus plicatilis]|uniref:Uncharacterized protein n=1 Tax=Brachionus plicatilis TaxID=10195 RepID=A0A3M7SBJ3_BRAPC|nr:hypothetical protein BpHYR1_037589 [Brachionus plicatilis]
MVCFIFFLCLWGLFFFYFSVLNSKQIATILSVNFDPKLYRPKALFTKRKNWLNLYNKISTSRLNLFTIQSLVFATGSASFLDESLSELVVLSALSLESTSSLDRLDFVLSDLQASSSLSWLFSSTSVINTVTSLTVIEMV